MSEQTTSLLSADIRERISNWILRYPPEQKRSGVFEALRLVQEQNGHLTTELMDAVADFLEMPKVAVYEVATFYTMYYLSPVGEHVINVCTNISCSLNGADAVLQHLKQKLGVDLNENTPDGKFTIKEVECLGACVAAPVCQIGKQYYEKMSPEKIDAVLATLEGKHNG